MQTPFDAVRIMLAYADGGTSTTPTMDRWWAEWLMANEISSGFYKGRRVLSARIISV